MGHQHAHSHEVSFGRAFAVGIGLNLIFVIIEAVYGYIADSSALLADAGHNLSDVFSLVFAWIAAWLATKKPVGKYTYGYRKTTILVSLLNAVLLFGASGVILYHAIRKFWEMSVPQGDTIIWVAAVGIVINTITALLFMKGQKDDLNIRGAFLHMAADAGVSLGVVIAGLIIKYTGAGWIDPVISVVIVVIILWSTWKLFRDSLSLVLDAVPEDIDSGQVYEYLYDLTGVEEVHDLHIWALSTTRSALTAHLVMPEGHSDEFLFEVRDQLNERFGIEHTTLQIEKTFDDEAYRPHCC